jgi:hypothetical protein
MHVVLLDDSLVFVSSKFLSSKIISKYFPSGVHQCNVTSCKENLYFHDYTVFSESFIFILVGI